MQTQRNAVFYHDDMLQGTNNGGDIWGLFGYLVIFEEFTVPQNLIEEFGAFHQSFLPFTPNSASLRLSWLFSPGLEFAFRHMRYFFSISFSLSVHKCIHIYCVPSTSQDYKEMAGSSVTYWWTGISCGEWAIGLGKWCSLHPQWAQRACLGVSIKGYLWQGDLLPSGHSVYAGHLPYLLSSEWNHGDIIIF